jgi:hypothetical protein
LLVLVEVWRSCVSLRYGLLLVFVVERLVVLDVEIPTCRRAGSTLLAPL